MKTKYKIAIALVAGAAIGGAVNQGLHAQAKPVAYVITETEVLDQAALKEYLPKVTKVIEADGGKYLSRGSKITALEGPPPKRVIVQVYDSVEKAQAVRMSAAWKELAPLRAKAIKAHAYIIEGTVD